MNFPERLKKLRKEYRLTQEELGSKINVTKVSISGYENGNRTPDTETLQRIADYFEVSTDFLLGRTSNLNLKTESAKYMVKAKEEIDIAKRLEQIKKDLESGSSDGDGLAFHGEPMSEEAIDSLMDAMELIVRQTQRINKKYIPKKYRDKETE